MGKKGAAQNAPVLAILPHHPPPLSTARPAVLPSCRPAVLPPSHQCFRPSLALCRLPCKHGCIFPTPFHSLRFPALLRLTLGASALIRRFVCPSLQFCRDSVPQIQSRRPDSLCRLRHGWCRQAIPSSLYSVPTLPLFCLSTRHPLQPSPPLPPPPDLAV